MREEIVPTTLEDFLRDQLETQRTVYGVDPSELLPSRQTEYIRRNVLALMHEAHEALDETPWKDWSWTKPMDTGRYLDELVDVLNFLLNLMLATGLPPQELAETVETRFYAKKKLNLQRHG